MMTRKCLLSGHGMSFLFVAGLSLIAASCRGEGSSVIAPAAQAETAPSATPSASVTPSPTASGAVVTFTQINQSILQPSCVSCHSSSNAAGRVDLSTYQGVLAQVSPGNPDQSRLYQVVNSGQMPPSGKLPQDQIQQLNDWIAAGAKND